MALLAPEVRLLVARSVRGYVFTMPNPQACGTAFQQLQDVNAGSLGRGGNGAHRPHLLPGTRDHGAAQCPWKSVEGETTGVD